jgi:hypothetical protein
MTPTVGGIPVRIGETYYAVRGDVPRRVVDIRPGGTVIVQNLDGGREWGVRRFSYNYYRKSEK